MSNTAIRMENDVATRLKVWWVPQVPMNAFEVSVASVAEGVKVMDVLANYDLFQFENRVKPDYCNMGGLLMFEDGEWVDWYDDDTHQDDPREYLATLPTSES